VVGGLLGCFLSNRSIRLPLLKRCWQGWDHREKRATNRRAHWAARGREEGLAGIRALSRAPYPQKGTRGSGTSDLFSLRPGGDPGGRQDAPWVLDSTVSRNCVAVAGARVEAAQRGERSGWETETVLGWSCAAPALPPNAPVESYAVNTLPIAADHGWILLQAENLRD